MSEKQIKENEFFGAPGGQSGTANYQTGYGTFASPDVSQNPAHFQSGKSVDNHSNTVQDVPKAGQLAKDLKAIYGKKDTPTPDEVVSGLKYELGQQIKKDKRLAKETVLGNLRKDPHYYGQLKMLNIDDESMVDNMQESKHPNDAPARISVRSNPEETKKIFAELAKGKDNKYVVNSQIVDVMKQMWEQKRARNAWRG